MNTNISQERKLVPKANFIDDNREVVEAVTLIMYVAIFVYIMFAIGTILTMWLAIYNILALVFLTTLFGDKKYPKVVAGPLAVEVLLASKTLHIASSALYKLNGKYKEVGTVADRMKKIRQIRRKLLWRRLYPFGK